jgi:protoheme IX farnesyltransferase
VNNLQSKTQEIPVKRRLPSFKELLALTKPTIGLLVVVTAVPSMLMAGGSLPGPIVFIATMIGTILASSAAAIYNQIIDSDIDEKMARTENRPLPQNVVSAPQAFAIATGLSLLSLAILYFLTTPLAAYIALAANAFYVLVYTMFLKRRTTQNIVIGGAAGAVGPLIGWAAVAGSLSWEAWTLFAIIFLWTPSHFWALSLKYKDDYAAAGVPMLPVIKGVAHTKVNIFLYSLTLVPPLVLLYMGGSVGLLFFIPVMALTLIYIYKCTALLTGFRQQTAMQVFHFSCMYLFVLFAFLTVDRFLIL